MVWIRNSFLSGVFLVCGCYQEQSKLPEAESVVELPPQQVPGDTALRQTPALDYAFPEQSIRFERLEPRSANDWAKPGLNGENEFDGLFDESSEKRKRELTVKPMFDWQQGAILPGFSGAELTLRKDLN